MYKFLLLIFILILSGCQTDIEVSNYTDDIVNNSIIFYNSNNINSVIIYSNNKYILYILNGNKINLNNYYKILPRIDYIISRNNINLDKKVIDTYRIYQSIKLNDITVTIDDKIEINLNNENICIYDKNISELGDYSLCNYIYILNNEKDVYINLNDNMKVLFYNEYSKFSNKFLEHLYTTWIDTYTVTKDTLIILELSDSDYNIREITS